MLFQLDAALEVLSGMTCCFQLDAALEVLSGMTCCLQLDAALEVLSGDVSVPTSINYEEIYMK